MRIRVVGELELLAAGLSPAQVLRELPDLKPEDIKACLRYASQRLSHPVLAVCLKRNSRRRRRTQRHTRDLAAVSSRPDLFWPTNCARTTSWSWLPGPDSNQRPDG